jgi:pyruvate dehydrogenase E1 component alpha subunit
VTPADLIAFEREVAERWDAGRIRAPCHLSGGNEAQLIEIFQRIDQQDWVLSTYRWHYHALLHGIPRETVMQWILDGRGMNVASAEHRFMTSAIVGGLLPVAVGIAAGLRRSGSERSVWCFVGDMTATLGAFHDASQYASRNCLPVTFYVEDNGMSCNSPTSECWGSGPSMANTKWYYYTRTYPHVSTGKFVNFT